MPPNFRKRGGLAESKGLVWPFITHEGYDSPKPRIPGTSSPSPALSLSLAARLGFAVQF